jgi:hypothetical protein
MDIRVATTIFWRPYLCTPHWHLQQPLRVVKKPHCILHVEMLDWIAVTTTSRLTPAVCSICRLGRYISTLLTVSQSMTAFVQLEFNWPDGHGHGGLVTTEITECPSHGNYSHTHLSLPQTKLERRKSFLPCMNNHLSSSSPASGTVFMITDNEAYFSDVS